MSSDNVLISLACLFIKLYRGYFLAEGVFLERCLHKPLNCNVVAGNLKTVCIIITDIMF